MNKGGLYLIYWTFLEGLYTHIYYDPVIWTQELLSQLYNSLPIPMAAILNIFLFKSAPVGSPTYSI